MIHGKKRNRIPINVINTRGGHLDLLGHTISTRRHAVDQNMLSCCNAVSSITRDKLKKKEKGEKEEGIEQKFAPDRDRNLCPRVLSRKHHIVVDSRV